MPRLTKREQAATREEMITAITHLHAPEPRTVVVHQLVGDGEEPEVLAFLAERPVQTVMMNGLIRDNGLDSPFNRGRFYACRDQHGQLEGVALIGHATLVEARSDAALRAFAEVAQQRRDAHMILGEQQSIQRFWQYYAGAGQPPRLYCRELLFEQRWPVEACEPVRGLRPATLDDLMLILPVHAALAYEESGINPLETDLAGFRMRCARRIEQGRVWLLVEEGSLVFKADIASDTPECIYLEGLYVDLPSRRRGYGMRCLLQMTRELLGRTRAVSALVNEQNFGAQSLFHKSGYRLRGTYDTIFLQRAASETDDEARTAAAAREQEG